MGFGSQGRARVCGVGGGGALCGEVQCCVFLE